MRQQAIGIEDEIILNVQWGSSGLGAVVFDCAFLNANITAVTIQEYVDQENLVSMVMPLVLLLIGSRSYMILAVSTLMMQLRYSY